MGKPILLNAAGMPLRMQDTAHFAASRSARELKSWNPITLSPDAELNTELSTLVERSRDISRNHGVASGAVQTLVDNVVGTGLRLRALPDYQAIGKDRTWAAEWTRTVESKFSQYAGSVEFDAGRLMNFYAMTQVVFRYGILSGEAVNRGEIEAPDFYENKAAYCRCQWMGPGRGLVDPEKEGKAVKLKWENGTTTLAHENAEQGQDWETTMEQRAEEVKRAMEIASEKGIPVEYLLPTATVSAPVGGESRDVGDEALLDEDKTR